MNRISAGLAFAGCLLLGLVAWLVLASSGDQKEPLRIVGLLFAIFFFAGILSLTGRALLIVAVIWMLLLGGLVALVVMSNPDMGLLDGGFVLFCAFFYLLAGTVFATTDWIRSRRVLNPLAPSR